MPVRTMESAAPRTRSSLTLQANLFQLFQPIGGVRASPLSSAHSGMAAKTNPMTNANRFMAPAIISAPLRSLVQKISLYLRHRPPILEQRLRIHRKPCYQLRQFRRPRFCLFNRPRNDKGLKPQKLSNRRSFRDSNPRGIRCNRCESRQRQLLTLELLHHVHKLLRLFPHAQPPVRQRRPFRLPKSHSPYTFPCLPNGHTAPRQCLSCRPDKAPRPRNVLYGVLSSLNRISR